MSVVNGSVKRGLIARMSSSIQIKIEGKKTSYKTLGLNSKPVSSASVVMNLQRSILLPILFLILSGCLHARPARELRLKRIDVNADVAVSQSEVEDYCGLKAGNMYTPDELELAKDSLFTGLNAAGWFLAEITDYEIQIAEDVSEATLHILLDPGPPAIVDTVILSGPLGGRGSEIQSRFRTKQGRRFNPVVWAADMERAVTWLENRGFPFAKAETARLTPEFSGDSILVTAEMRITPGLAVTIDELEVAGLTRTKQKVARRILSIRPGRLYNPSRAERAKRRLLRTGWFSEVQTAEIFRNQEGRFGLVYKAQEQPTSSVSGALGYAPQGEDTKGVTGQIDASFGNLFGTGRRLDFNWQRVSDDERSFAVLYREPYLFGAPLNLDIQLSQENIDSVYLARVYGLEATYMAGMTWEVLGGIKRREIHADSTIADNDSLSYNLIGFTAGIRIDTRDRATNPSIGGYYEVRTERYLPTGESSDQYQDQFVNSISVRHNLPVGRGFIIHGGVSYKEITVDSGQPPYAEWVRIGGGSTVRGYLENSLTAPRAGWSTIELRRLLGPESRVFLFADAAVLSRVDDTSWKSSLGAGLQLDAGGGIMNIAIALPSGQGLNQSVVHASVSTRF